MDNIRTRIKNLSKLKKTLLVLLFIITVYPFWYLWAAAILAIYGMSTLRKNSYLKDNKKAAITVFVIMWIVLAGLYGYDQNKSNAADNARRNKIALEKSRNYSIKAKNSEYTFACNATYEDSDQTLSCESQTITGEFTKYETTDVPFASTNGSTFTYNAKRMIDYKSESVDTESLINGAIDDLELTVYNDYLNEDVASTKVKVKYTFDSDDISLIERKNTEWKAQEAARKIKPTITVQGAVIDGDKYRLNTAASKSILLIEVKDTKNVNDKVTVNNEAAKRKDQSNVYEYAATLKSGENKMEIRVTNEHGTESVKTLIVTYTPPAAQKPATGTGTAPAPSTPSPAPDKKLDDALFEAEITCQNYAEMYFNVKNVNIHYDQASIKKQLDNGSLLIKARIADSQGILKPEKPLGMMECTTSSNGMQVLDFISY